MSNQYNLVADQYDLSFQLVPFRLHVEAYSVFEVLGNIAGKSVLDLATGTGFYARALRQQGAAKVVGVDVAEEMVQIARTAESAEPLGIDYHVQDVTSFKADEPFDIALAIYLLHYSPTKEVLQAMCNAIAGNLKSGGRFVTYQLNPDISREAGYYSDLGLNLTVPSQPSDGEPVPFSVTIGDMTMPEIMAYRWTKDTINSALTTAGFESIKWIDPKLSPQGAEQYGDAMFGTYLKQPHALLIECVKP